MALMTRTQIMARYDGNERRYALACLKYLRRERRTAPDHRRYKLAPATAEQILEAVQGSDRLTCST